MNGIAIITGAALALITVPIWYIVFRTLLTRIRTPRPPKADKVKECDLNKIMGYDFIIIQNPAETGQQRERTEKETDGSAPDPTTSALATDIRPDRREQESIEQVSIGTTGWREAKNRYREMYLERRERENRYKQNRDTDQGNTGKEDKPEPPPAERDSLPAEETEIITFSEETDDSEDWQVNYDSETLSRMSAYYDEIENERLRTLGVKENGKSAMTPQERADCQKIQEKLRRVTIDVHRDLTEEEQEHVDQIVNMEED